VLLPDADELLFAGDECLHHIRIEMLAAPSRMMLRAMVWL
jgi:hypothetical protein